MTTTTATIQPPPARAARFPRVAPAAPPRRMFCLRITQAQADKLYQLAMLRSAAGKRASVTGMARAVLLGEDVP